jgi:eukaryotic-like serine/threonine-protein kinase
LKCCPTCQRLYAEDGSFCPIDGVALRLVDDVPVPDDPDDRRIGKAICAERYQVRRKVADGGMGRVYQAFDLQKKESVAVKVLHPEVSGDSVALERFKREYALSSELPHEHIVEVRDFQRTEDKSYALVMEYLEGEELRHFLQREKAMPAARLVRILSQIAIGLKGPHDRKLVHRDIKPDNVFLCHTEDGPRVKLLDFGSVRDNTEGAKKLTVIGTTIGSPFYMSPEQAQGLAGLDHRADVWSLAAIGYECLTGKVPFGGKTGPQILLAILAHEPEPASIAGKERGVPPSVDDVFSDALAKDPQTRIGSVAELADRFGAAYGLEGSHRDWAYMSEMQLETLIEQNLPRVRDQKSSKPTATAPPVTEDDFVMGVPSGPPTGLYIGIGLGVVVVVGVVAFFLLG